MRPAAAMLEAAVAGVHQRLEQGIQGIDDRSGNAELSQQILPGAEDHLATGAVPRGPTPAQPHGSRIRHKDEKKPSAISMKIMQNLQVGESASATRGENLHP